MKIRYPIKDDEWIAEHGYVWLKDIGRNESPKWGIGKIHSSRRLFDPIHLKRLHEESALPVKVCSKRGSAYKMGNSNYSVFLSPKYAKKIVEFIRAQNSTLKKNAKQYNSPTRNGVVFRKSEIVAADEYFNTALKAGAFHDKAKRDFILHIND